MTLDETRGYDLFLLFSQGWNTRQLIGIFGYKAWMVYRWHQKYKEAQQRIKARISTLRATMESIS